MFCPIFGTYLKIIHCFSKIQVLLGVLYFICQPCIWGPTPIFVSRLPSHYGPWCPTPQPSPGPPCHNCYQGCIHISLSA